MTRSKSILLTGGTGLIGTSLAEAISAAGFTLKVLSRTKPKPLKGLEWIPFDMTLGKLPDASYLDGIDIIVHNAASLKVGINEEELREIEAVNISFTNDLLEQGGNAGVEKVIFTSGLSFIKKPLPAIITEDAHLESSSPYITSKLNGERITKASAHKFGFQSYILRISSPVADRIEVMPQTVVRRWIESALAGKDIIVFGTGSRTQNFVSVRDISQAYLKFLKGNAPSGIYNIASDDQLSMKELAYLISEKWKVGVQFSGEDANEADRWCISIEKAKKAIGYQPYFTSKTAILNLINNINFNESRSNR